MEKNIRRKMLLTFILSVALIFSLVKYVENTVEEVEIVVAKTKLQAGTIIDSSMLKTVKVNKEAKEKYMANTVANVNKLKGGLLLKEIDANQPFYIDASKISFNSYQIKMIKQDPDFIDQVLIPRDMRLISIGVDKVGSMNRTLQKGQIVDVMFTSNTSKTGGTYSRLIAQKLEIYSVESATDLEDRELQEITLLVKPELVTIITAAKRNGKIDLNLTSLDSNYHKSKPIFTYQFANYKSIQRDYEDELIKYLSYYFTDNKIESKIKNVVLEEIGFNDLIEDIESIRLKEYQEENLKSMVGGE